MPQSSVFNASEQKELMTAVNATDDAKKCGLRPRQEASSFKEFLTEGGVRALQDGLATAFQKIDKMPKRMVSMGLINPTEELLYTANYINMYLYVKGIVKKYTTASAGHCFYHSRLVKMNMGTFEGWDAPLRPSRTHSKHGCPAAPKKKSCSCLLPRHSR